MKKEMEIKLYKLEIIQGKESIAEEWLEFLKQNKEAGKALLKEEKAYFEAYFKSMENGNMYIYLFFSAEDINFSNKKALHLLFRQKTFCLYERMCRPLKRRYYGLSSLS